MMKAYLAIKYQENKNKKLIEDVSRVVEQAGYQTTVMFRDYEKWGKKRFTSQELMELSFKLIQESDCLIIEFSEKGVGLGIEAGYAYAKKIPIIVVAKEGSDISATLQGIAKKIIFYKNIEELEKSLKETNLRTSPQHLQ